MKATTTDQADAPGVWNGHQPIFVSRFVTFLTATGLAGFAIHNRGIDDSLGACGRYCRRVKTYPASRTKIIVRIILGVTFST